jgi:hypothetical protein
MTTELEYLVSLFPQQSREELARALEAHGGDVERTASYLLEEVELSEAPSSVDLADPWESDTAHQAANETSAGVVCSPTLTTAPNVQSLPPGERSLSEDEALARQLQAEFDREWAETLRDEEQARNRFSASSASARSGVNPQRFGVGSDRPLVADMREALGHAQETLSHWWHSLKGTVQSWVSEHQLTNSPSRRHPNDDPMAGPLHNYTIAEATSEEHSEGIVDESDASDQRWSQTSRDSRPSTTSLYHRAQPNFSSSFTPTPSSKKDA